jgi:hypothetical protein
VGSEGIKPFHRHFCSFNDTQQPSLRAQGGRPSAPPNSVMKLQTLQVIDLHSESASIHQRVLNFCIQPDARVRR